MNPQPKNSTGKLIEFGLRINEVQDPKAFVLGGSIELPKIILQENGQWDAFLPVYEPQYNEFFDSYGCTIWGWLNAIEIMEKRMTGIEHNYAERFNYILAKIKPPGADPHQVAEVIRERGAIKQELLPLTPEMTFEEFNKPNPMTKSLLEEGMKFPYEMKHQYLWPVGKKLTPEERKKILKEHLQYSVIPLSVTAWFQNVKGTYIDTGERNTHWCVLIGWNEKGDDWYNPELPEGWKIFDSYEQSVKIVDFELHNFEIAKRIHLDPSNYLPQLSLIGKILELIGKILTLDFEFLKASQPVSEPKPTPTPSEPPKPQPEPIKEPKPSLLNAWAKAIEQFENAPKSWNNPGAIRGLDGKFLKFRNYEEGFEYLKDYLVRAATGKHRAYPKGGETTLIEFQNVYAPAADNNDPHNYASFIANKLAVSLEEKIKNLI